MLRFPLTAYFHASLAPTMLSQKHRWCWDRGGIPHARAKAQALSKPESRTERESERDHLTMERGAMGEGQNYLAAWR